MLLLDREKTRAGNLVQFLAWVAARPRSYDETMEAWRTSCPRLSAWEDALDEGLVRVEAAAGSGYGSGIVRLTPRGTALLDGRTS